MSVFFKTGDNTAASVSWPVYLFLILPFQVLYWFAKLLVLLFVWIGISVVFLVGATRRARSARKTPHPEG